MCRRMSHNQLLASLSIALVGCVDQPVMIAPPHGGPPASSLSALGIFVGNPAQQIPSAGFVPYDVNVNLYSDEAHKHRFLYVPRGTQIHATADRWELPVGAILVKTFFYYEDARDPNSAQHLIETRFLVKERDRLVASTYVWNDAQTDAFASGGDIDVPTAWIDEDGLARNDHFHIPGTSQCMTCHENRFLGMRTRQMDRAATFRDGTTNQVAHLVAAGILDVPPPEHDALPDPLGDAPLPDRARAYLDANCSHCHAVDGQAAGTHVYFDREDLIAHAPICRPTNAIAGANHVIYPGDPTRSEFLQRMRSSDAFNRMPRGPSHIPDRRGLAVLDAWVASLTPAGCP
jgi:uncharacterized repeat protein (TIGR03806 family)